MKRTILIVLAVVSFSGVLSAQAPPQTTAWANQRITFRVDHDSLLNILGVVAKAGNLTLQVDEDLKTVLEKPATADFREGRIGDILSFVLKVAGLTYKSTDGNTIQLIRP